MVQTSIKLSRDDIHQMNSCMPERKYQALGRNCITFAEEYYDVRNGEKAFLEIAYCLSNSGSHEYHQITEVKKLRDLTRKFVGSELDDFDEEIGNWDR